MSAREGDGGEESCHVHIITQYERRARLFDAAFIFIYAAWK